jgi:hypothetical protein
MQEGNGPIELHTGLFSAGDGKVNRAQRVVGMLPVLASRFVRVAQKQDYHQPVSKAPKGAANYAFHGLNCFAARGEPVCHVRFSH